MLATEDLRGDAASATVEAEAPPAIAKAMAKLKRAIASGKEAAIIAAERALEQVEAKLMRATARDARRADLAAQVRREHEAAATLEHRRTADALEAELRESAAAPMATIAYAGHLLHINLAARDDHARVVAIEAVTRILRLVSQDFQAHVTRARQTLETPEITDTIVTNQFTADAGIRGAARLGLVARDGALVEKEQEH